MPVEVFRPRVAFPTAFMLALELLVGMASPASPPFLGAAVHERCGFFGVACAALSRLTKFVVTASTAPTNGCLVVLCHGAHGTKTLRCAQSRPAWRGLPDARVVCV